MITTIRVQVSDAIREYPAGIAAFGDHLAHGGAVLSLPTAQSSAREFFAATPDRTWQAVSFWVALDDSGLAYHVEINRRGRHLITAAAPLPGPSNVREVYTA